MHWFGAIKSFGFGGSGRNDGGGFQFRVRSGSTGRGLQNEEN